jgi:hypothetical protein
MAASIGFITNKRSNNQMADIQFNAEQQEAIDAVCNFESVAIIGSAGTGKSTIMREAATRLVADPRMPILRTETKYLKQGASGIIAVSFTHTAVNNINKLLDGVISCYTIHKLIEFEPVSYEYTDEDGNTKTKRVFEPQRNRENPLPRELRTIIIEESGIVSISLMNQLLAALPAPEAVQFIFLGDLFQLNPPYDPSILGFVLAKQQIRKVELTQVYRQKLHSPILSFALDIKDRKPVPSNKFEERTISTEHGTLIIKPWKHRIDEFKATIEAAKFLNKEWASGAYNPNRDMVIIPFNKRFGTTELNKLIADFLGKARGAEVHEIIAGYDRHYLAIGDAVFVNKRKGTIAKIESNKSYLGTQTPQSPSKHLDRFGYNSEKHKIDEAAIMQDATEAEHDAAMSEIDRLMAASLADNEDRTRSASHKVTVRFGDDDMGWETVLESTGDFSLNKFDFGYCLTCYKAQGSEWPSVYVFTHKSHAVALCNEFFYTAVTRAKQKLVLICEPSHLVTPMLKQEVPGDNWKTKSVHFKKNFAKLGAHRYVAKFILGE